MAEVKEYTFQDVAEHNTKNDMFCVIHDKVYDCTKFLDEHPYVFNSSPPPLYLPCADRPQLTFSCSQRW